MEKGSGTAAVTWPFSVADAPRRRQIVAAVAVVAAAVIVKDAGSACCARCWG